MGAKLVNGCLLSRNHVKSSVKGPHLSAWIVNLLTLNKINHISLTSMMSLTHTSHVTCFSHTLALQVPDIISQRVRSGTFNMLSFELIDISCQSYPSSLCSVWPQSSPLICFSYHISRLPLFFDLPCTLFPVQLSVQARLEVIKRASKSLRQLAEKSRKKGSDNSGEHEGTNLTGMTFEEALSHLQQSQAHLDTLSHAFVLSLKDSQQVGHICHSRLCLSFRMRISLYVSVCQEYQ